MTRKQILEAADRCVNGERQEQYGTPEDNFRTIAEFWQIYLSKKPQPTTIDAHDVAIMMALLKVARIASGTFKEDSYIDACGYLACGGELGG
jgi:hypothetical protein